MDPNALRRIPFGSSLQHEDAESFKNRKGIASIMGFLGLEKAYKGGPYKTLFVLPPE